MSELAVEWHDHGREPQCKPDPNYPDGKDIRAVRNDDVPTCHTTLPYPAKRCGVYLVHCDTCQLSVGVTTAGRPDDPRSLTVECLKVRK